MAEHKPQIFKREFNSDVLEPLTTKDLRKALKEYGDDYPVTVTCPDCCRVFDVLGVASLIDTNDKPIKETELILSDEEDG